MAASADEFFCVSVFFTLVAIRSAAIDRKKDMILLVDDNFAKL
jgi:hypothetical protein